MIPAKYDITLYRGDTFRRTFRIRTINEDKTPGPYADLTGCTPLAQVRSAERAPTIVETIGSVILDQTDPATLGSITISLTATQTAELADSTRWDIQLTHPNGDVHTYLAGGVTAKGQVTF